MQEERGPAGPLGVLTGQLARQQLASSSRSSVSASRAAASVSA
jgi:hypothetical protein